MSRRTRTWRLNRRALVILSGLALALVALVALQQVASSLGRGRPALLAQAEALVKEGKPDMALTFLNRHLEGRPDDARALDLKARLLDESARTPENLAEAIAVHNLVTVRDPSAGPERLETRRRLVGLYLKQYELDPARQKLTAAEAAAQELVDLAPKDAGALRLLARVQQARATSTSGAADKDLLARAIANYEKAGKVDPKDVDGAERLARLYAGPAGAPEKGARVLDALVEHNPTAPAFLARYRFHAGADGSGTDRPSEASAREAAASLKRAVELAPDGFDVQIAAAEDALRQGASAEARRHLDRIPKGRQEDSRVRYVRGQIDLNENRSEEAIEAWRKGLVASGGSDPELTWRLAFVLLQLNRPDEAEPLMAQFRRLIGAEPTAAWLFLDGLRLLKRGHAAAAVVQLKEATRGGRGGASLSNQIEYALGQAYEATRDEAAALDAYSRAGKAAPRWVAPRLARIRLLQSRQPAVAAAELARARVELPDDPAVTIALAREELARQSARARRGKPSWEELNRLLAEARRLAPTAPGLALIEAEARALQGGPDEAIALLEQAVRHNKKDVDLWSALAARQADRGHADAALLSLERATAPEAAGDRIPLRILRARLLTRQGRGQEAREALVRDLDHLPVADRPQAWMELGNLYLAQKDQDQARKAYAEWSRLLPDDPVPRLHLLELALAARDEAGGREQIEALSKLGGGQNLYYRIAKTYDLLRPHAGEAPSAQAERLEEAFKLIEAIRADAPQQHFSYQLEGQYWELRQQPEKAVEAYERAVEIEKTPASLGRLVTLYTQLKRDADLNRIRREYADAAPGLGRLEAETALRLGDRERAARLGRMAAEADPGNPDTLVWLAKLYNTVDRPDDAEKVLRDAVARFREEPAPWLALLTFQVSRKQMDEARKTVERIRATVTKVDRPEYFFAQCCRVAGDTAGAEDQYEKALAKWPDDPQVVRGVAEYFEATGRADRAQRCLEDCLRRDPSQRWAARGLALLLTAHSREPAAWDKAWTYVSGESPGSDTADDRLARAIILTRGPRPEQQLKQAAEILEQLVRDLPAGLAATGTARGLLGRIYQKEGQFGKAAELARADATAVRAAPAEVAAYAETLILAKKWDEARAQIDRLGSLPPGDLTAAKLTASLELAQGRPAEAAAALEKAFAGRRGSADGEAAGREVVALLLQMNLADPAERVARGMAEAWPRSSGVLATILARRGRREQAFELYGKAVAEGDAPAAREAVLNAVSLATSGARDPAEMERAYALVEAALKRHPEAADLRVKAAYLRHFQHRYDEEVGIYREMLAGKPVDFTFLNNMAWTLSECLKRHDEALERINEAFRRTGGRFPQFYDTRGVIYTHLKKYKEAISDLEDAVRSRPTGTMYAHLARAYHLAGQEEKFREARDAARKAGLTPDQLEPSERTEIEPLLFAAQ